VWPASQSLAGHALIVRWNGPEGQQTKAASPCFACPPTLDIHDPKTCVRTLCAEHMARTQTISGASLPDVIANIESQMSEGWLEGAPLQWLFGPIRVGCYDGANRTGWCFFVPAIYLVAEDRFGASSWLDFWITDLSLDAADLRRPTLDALARSLPKGRHPYSILARWAVEVGGPEGINELNTAWMIWAGETRVAQRRASTGRVWPRADELSDWVVAPGEPGQAEFADVDSFASALVQSLRTRAEHLGGQSQ